MSRPKGGTNRKHTGEFKQKAVEDMRQNELSQHETSRKYGIVPKLVRQWERIYLERGVEGLYEDRRGTASNGRSGRPPNLDKRVSEDLIEENQRLRMEVDYLKKLNALVQQQEQQKNKKLR